jgi:hypothetical protein
MDHRVCKIFYSYALVSASHALLIQQVKDNLAKMTERGMARLPGGKENHEGVAEDGNRSS